MVKNDKLKVATVFSGIGSLEYAMKKIKIKHEIVFACDIDPFAKKTYFANFEINEKKWFNDIYEIDGYLYKNKVDILAGGSPCQSFSTVGKKGGLNDPRGQLVYEFIRLIKEIQPRMFIYENVKGLLHHDNGETWRSILADFQTLGYKLKYDVLNAKDFGIPQNRDRIFLLGFKKEQHYEFPKKTTLKFELKDFLLDNYNSSMNIKNNVKIVRKKYHYTKNNKSIVIKRFNFKIDTVGKKYILSEKLTKYVSSYGTKGYLIKPIFDRKIAKTILQSCHKMHRAGIDNYITVKPNKVRKLTPRECVRLMGYDDDFILDVSDTQVYRQAGNSIVVEVLIYILLNIDYKKAFNYEIN
jgi:DNA (cytosine-5)-methyltransferase 1